MFESDDYDQALSQLDFPEPNINLNDTESTLCIPPIHQLASDKDQEDTEVNYQLASDKDPEDTELRLDDYKTHERQTINKENRSSPNSNLSKRIIVNTHFDQNRKRKFPGPAGLLSGTLKRTKDESVSHIEILSQDVDFSPNNLFSDVLETPLWKRLLEDTKSLKGINTINSIKECGFYGKLRSKKANIVIAVVEAIDRFAADPLITLRDSTGQIKSTLHRDAWKCLSTYIVSQYCALVLCKPTIFTTGSISKKHYLNITLRNISKIYSSAIAKDDDELPEGFQIKCEEGFSIITATPINSVANISSNFEDENLDLLDGLDGAFTDEM